MKAPVSRLSASLEIDGRRVEVELFPRTHLSLGVRLPPTTSFPVGTTFSRLVVPQPGGEVTLTRTQLAVAPTADEPGGLVFLDDVYDCDALLNEGRAKNLLGFLSELPLVLGLRDQIGPEFRAWVADLNYDLTVYKKFFDQQDRLFQLEPPEVAHAAQQALLAHARRDFFGYLDGTLARLSELVHSFTPEEHERHGYYFRQQLWPFIMGSAFMRRTNLKPRGYAGDAVMMDMIYDDAFEGEWVFNKLLHKHPIEHPGAQAVRNRRVKVPELLHEVRVARAGGLKVLSVACGPARELDDVFRTQADCRAVSITLLDQDEEALHAAQATVKRVEAKLGASIDARLVNQSVRTLLRDAELPSRLGRFGFIYTMGMFDYLTPPVARAVLERLYALLEPGGVIVVGNYHVSNASRYYMAYWLDWILYYRTEGEMLEMAGRLGDARASVSFDDSRCQMFLRVEKPA
ncbi:MAG: class I SAM-dependent methyltransferase [Myxococcaceae bacterium]|nr:class I SAM-dependent methyltransferase [Myxococcaceae bacterium]